MSLNRPPHQLVATVLGAGTMGAQIAAHLANAGIRTHLLDIVPRDTPADAPAAKRSAIATGAIKTMLKGKPAPYMDKAFAARITPGNLDDDLEAAVAASDLVIEAVIERLDIKRPLFERMGKAAPAHTVLATNTSGLPIGDIAEGLPEGVAKRVVGMHWFNPPRYMHLLEIVPSKHTDPEVAKQLGDFSDRVLGKGVVVCRDTPNFIGNRIGVAEMILTNAATFGGAYTVEEVDLLNARLMGRPKTGSFRLGDLVGNDVAALVVGNLAKATSSEAGAPNYDELHAQMVVHPVLEKMFEKGMKGDKTGQGFYKKTKERDAKGKRKILTLDLETLEYRDRIEPKFAELASVAKLRPLSKRVRAALRVEGRAGNFVRQVYLPLLAYAANRLGEICDGPHEIDAAMRWGYGWDEGPFWLWDAVGLGWAVEQMKAAGHAVSPKAEALLAAHGADATWYRVHGGVKQQWTGAGYEAIPEPSGMIILDQTKAQDGAIIEENEDASLIDLGDGIACLEFHSKMNSLGEKVVTMVKATTDILEKKGGFRGWVIANQASHFSAGANLFAVLAMAGQSKWDELEASVREFQDTSMLLRHGPFPVVAAPHHMALAGGCEFSMHCAAMVADAELYMGLVEVGVGLIPAGGGLKEIARRASEWAAQVEDGDPYPFVRRGFFNAAQGSVSTSAYEAKNAGWLRPTDDIVFHKSRVVAEAKRRAISLAEGGWTPPDPNAPITVVGAPHGASFMMGAQLFSWGGYASEHDKLLAEKIGHVLSGGMTPSATTVTAQDLLDLEREAFVSLCGEQKTRDRIAHMLSNGKPLRN